jgi:threonine dehydrogenase-like Zn-dependent dehydrogenase
MLAVHLEDGVVSVREAPIPARPPGHALLRLLCGGICNTDLELRRGYYGFAGTPGHEFVAEVTEADDRSLRGRRVVGEINLACAVCEWCRKGLGRHCPNRTVLGIAGHPGAFSEYFTLPERNLHTLDDSLPTERAVFTEPLAAACEILEQVAIPCDDPVAVLGDGKLGLLAAMVLQAHGHPVRLFGHHAHKLRMASAAGVMTEDVSGPLPAARFNWVVEATGSPAGLRAAAALCRPRGTVILKSTVHGEVPIDCAPIVVNEITLVGSRCGRFEAALPLLAHRLIPVEEMIAARYPLREAAAAFDHAARPGTLKVLLDARVPSLPS